MSVHLHTPTVSFQMPLIKRFALDLMSVVIQPGCWQVTGDSLSWEPDLHTACLSLVGMTSMCMWRGTGKALSRCHHGEWIKEHWPQAPNWSHSNPQIGTVTLRNRILSRILALEIVHSVPERSRLRLDLSGNGMDSSTANIPYTNAALYMT